MCIEELWALCVLHMVGSFKYKLLSSSPLPPPMIKLVLSWSSFWQKRIENLCGTVHLNHRCEAQWETKKKVHSPKGILCLFLNFVQERQGLPCPRERDLTKVQSSVMKWRGCHQRFGLEGHHPDIGTMCSYELWQESWFSVNFIFHLSVVKCHNYARFCPKLGREGNKTRTN